MKKYRGKYINLWGNAKIGDGTKIGSFVDIGGTVGRNCKIQSFAFIPEMVTIEDNCFIGPRVTFTNDKNPPSGGKDWAPTLVKSGARICADVTILPGVTIGENAFIGAGSLITESVPAGEVWYGSPATFIRKCETKLSSSPAVQEA